MSDFPLNVDRRRLLQGGSVIAASAAVTSLAGASRAAAQSAEPAEEATSTSDPRGRHNPLSFNSDGSFRIVQFNDTQDDHLTDARTIEFMGIVLDEQEPDFVVINGDVITGGPSTNLEVYQALNNVVLPMETRGIPWAVTWGNHDEDSTEEAGTTVFEPEMVSFLRQYRHNLNPVDRPELTGSSNGQLLINNSAGTEPAFGIWLLDSGRYAPDAPAGQEKGDLMGYDWIRSDQIEWYIDTSVATEEEYGRKIPSLMYFHIPTYEHHHMWFGQQFTSDEEGHAAAVELHGIEGVKNEGVYTGLFNSGIYAAAHDRGDVLGIYCGHDHINSYNGNYFGIELGYGPGTGFGPYGLNDGTWDQHTLRGARVFNLNENDARVYTDTFNVFAQDKGLDMNPEPQKLEQPAEFPEYVNVPGDNGNGDGGDGGNGGDDEGPSLGDLSSALSSR